MSRRAASDRAPAWRRRFVLATWLMSAAAVCARAGQIQILEASTWSELADTQHRTDKTVEATRGAILDRDGTPLAVSRERVRVSVAPREITDMAAARAALQTELGLSRAAAARLTSTERVWSVAPDLYPPGVSEGLQKVAGIHLERVFQRYHPHGDLARGVLGFVREDGALGGIEQRFDGFLGGTPGREVVARDNAGHPIPGERFVMMPPRAGGDVVLTLDMDLQEIAQQALEEELALTHARGGDVVITDPSTGEILALVSIHDGRSESLAAVNTPYEPGSTLKPFTLAALLENRLASLDDTVDVGDGTWEVEGRELSDTHTSGLLTVEEALRESSNVGFAKVAQALSPGMQYENLRDFGFGTLSGIELPGEVAGTLRRPRDWSAQSAASLAIGYEISATPLQMAMAYGALANGGLLMQPRLVRETRGPEGTPAETFEPRVIRRVVREEVADLVGAALVEVVEDGTGTSAQLSSFNVAGKTGTARFNSGHGYERGAYFASFAGFFPAEDPQLVVYVGLDRPQGTFYGGSVAAPVTRATMEAALAARATPLDRAALLKAARRQPLAFPNPGAPGAASFATVESAAPVVAEKRDPNVSVALPDVSGLPMRVAVRRLHGLGLRVSPAGAGEIVGTSPRPGDRVLPGDTIRLRLRAGDE